MQAIMDAEYLNWPFFSDEHRQFASRLADFATSEIAPIAHEAGDGTDQNLLDSTCRKLVKALAGAGFLEPSVRLAENQKFDVRTLCLGRDRLARTAGLADFVFAMQGLGSGPISLFGSDEQRRRYLPRVARGEAIAAFGLSEPGAGSDVAALTTTAVRDGNHYVINGVKTWISNGGIAEHYIVFARTGEAPGAKGLSAFIVEPDTAGFEVTDRIRVIGPHPIATLRFTDMRVPASAMIAGPGDGFKVAMGTLDVFRTTVGAAALGFARRALDEALSRVQQRMVFGKPLSTFQLTQAKIADMAIGVDAIALLVYRSAWTRDTFGRRVTREASMAKVFGTETAQQVIDMAVQLHGGTGVVSQTTVENLYREIRPLRIYEGTSEIQRMVIANEVMKSVGAATK